MKAKHTPTPFRIGDAGLTVFGPPNGNPSPETVCHCLNKANAQFIADACNNHERLLKENKEKDEMLIKSFNANDKLKTENAKLKDALKAAPELFKCLVDVVEWMDLRGESQAWPENSVFKTAKAAIAKARGE